MVPFPGRARPTSIKQFMELAGNILYKETTKGRHFFQEIQLIHAHITSLIVPTAFKQTLRVAFDALSCRHPSGPPEQNTAGNIGPYRCQNLPGVGLRVGNIGKHHKPVLLMTAGSSLRSPCVMANYNASRDMTHSNPVDTDGTKK